MQIEETAGMGLGLAVFAFTALGFCLAAIISRYGHSRKRDPRACWIVAGVGLALLVYMAKIGSESGPRLIAAYYPLMIAGVLVMTALDGGWTRNRFYQLVGLAALLSAFPLVVLSPARPLFPVASVKACLGSLHVPGSMIGRYEEVYGVYGARFDGFSSLKEYLPKTETAVGFMQTGNNPEASLWRPFGSRAMVEVTPELTREDLEGRQIHFIVIGKDALDTNYNIPIDELTSRWSAHLVAQRELVLLAQRGPETWYVLGL
jgi:hypothetical protein